MRDEVITLEEKTDFSVEFPKIIRRDLPHTKSNKPRLVSWNGNKIEKAVNAACVELGHEPVGNSFRQRLNFV